MILEQFGEFQDYQFLDSGDGARLERFGDFILCRPDPAALWQKSLRESVWEAADAVFSGRKSADPARTVIEQSADEDQRGNWRKKTEIPEKWLMHFAPAANPDQRISFYAKLTAFKHTGVFPEQAANWNFIAEKLGSVKKQPGSALKFLNLFGYTGIASVLAAKLGAEVTHVDASKPSLSWAKENMLASGLPESAIRWIYDDCLKFVKREVKRGKFYDAIILDPPAFGRGPKGELWKFNESLPKLLTEVRQILSPQFKFVVINAYAVSVSSILLKNLLEDFGFAERKVDYGELVLKPAAEVDRRPDQNKNAPRMLSTGIFGRLY